MEVDGRYFWLHDAALSLVVNTAILGGDVLLPLVAFSRLAQGHEPIGLHMLVDHIGKKPKRLVKHRVDAYAKELRR